MYNMNSSSKDPATIAEINDEILDIAKSIESRNNTKDYTIHSIVGTDRNNNPVKRSIIMFMDPIKLTSVI